MEAKEGGRLLDGDGRGCGCGGVCVAHFVVKFLALRTPMQFPLLPLPSVRLLGFLVGLSFRVLVYLVQCGYYGKAKLSIYLPTVQSDRPDSLICGTTLKKSEEIIRMD